MKKILITLALSVFVSTTVQAAFWDSWLSDSEDAAPAVTSSPAVKDASKVATQANIDTGENVVAGLIPSLTQQLGVSKTQASGGVGALLQIAKDNLDGNEFSQLSQSLPNVVSLLSAAPKLETGGLEDQLGGLLASAGSTGKALSDMSQLSSQFESLGLNSDMVSQFALVTIQYLQNGGGELAAELLQKGLGALLGGDA